MEWKEKWEIVDERGAERVSKEMREWKGINTRTRPLGTM